jgi:hypothetical protein
VWGALHLARHVVDLAECARPAGAAPAVPAETAVTVPSFPAEEHGNDLERRAQDY